MRRDILRLALMIATLQSAAVVAGNLATGGAVEREHGVRVPAIVAATYLAAVYVAYLLSKWGHLATTRWRSVALGIAIAIPAFTAFFAAVKPEYGWRVVLLSGVISGVVFGGIVSYIAWIEDA